MQAGGAGDREDWAAGQIRETEGLSSNKEGKSRPWRLKLLVGIALSDFDFTRYTLQSANFNLKYDSGVINYRQGYPQMMRL